MRVVLPVMVALLLCLMPFRGACAEKWPTPEELLERVGHEISKSGDTRGGDGLGDLLYAQDRLGEIYFAVHAAEHMHLIGKMDRDNRSVRRVILRLLVTDESDSFSHRETLAYIGIASSLLRMYAPSDYGYRKAMDLFAEFAVEAEKKGDSWLEMTLGEGIRVKAAMNVSENAFSASMEIEGD